jgi:hypothetical protein
MRERKGQRRERKRVHTCRVSSKASDPAAQSSAPSKPTTVSCPPHAPTSFAIVASVASPSFSHAGAWTPRSSGVVRAASRSATTSTISWLTVLPGTPTVTGRLLQPLGARSAARSEASLLAAVGLPPTSTIPPCPRSKPALTVLTSPPAETVFFLTFPYIRPEPVLVK